MTRWPRRSMSAFGVKRAWPIVVRMSAYDPKRTSWRVIRGCANLRLAAGQNATARLHQCNWGRTGRVATCCAGAGVGEASKRLSRGHRSKQRTHLVDAFIKGLGETGHVGTAARTNCAFFGSPRTRLGTSDLSAFTSRASQRFYCRSI
jgi:hypothetical protein